MTQEERKSLVDSGLIPNKCQECNGKGYQWVPRRPGLTGMLSKNRRLIRASCDECDTGVVYENPTQEERDRGAVGSARDQYDWLMKSPDERLAIMRHRATRKVLAPMKIHMIKNGIKRVTYRGGSVDWGRWGKGWPSSVEEIEMKDGTVLRR